MEISLEELKAANKAAEEAEAEQSNVEPEEEEQGQEALEEEEQESEQSDDAEESDEEEGESDESEDDEPSTLEAWQQSEESEDSQEDGKGTGFKPNPGAAALRRKLKDAKQNNSNLEAELQDLKQKFAQMSQGGYQVPQQQAPLKRPKLEDYDYDQDKYDEALDEYFDKKLESKLSQTTQQQQQTAQQQQAQQQAQSAIDDHYNRAAQLVSKGLVNEEDFASADGLIRQTIDSIAPGKGDELTDNLISKISGEGSEKLWVYLGRNATQLNRLRESLQNDPSGLSTMVMLGELKARATKPIQVKSKAPKPAPKLKGDAKAKATGLKKAYKSAYDDGDVGKMIELKRAAKAKGEDVSKW